MKQRRNRSESNYKRAKINSWCRLLEKDFDWDYTFLLEIERKKIIEMYEYFKKCTRSDKMPIVARDLQLCIGLLDIVLEKDNLQLEFSGMKTMRRDDGMYEMVESPHIIACRNLYINTKNASRFCLFNFPTDDTMGAGDSLTVLLIYDSSKVGSKGGYPLTYTARIINRQN